MGAKENARVQGGRKVTTDQRSELSRTHGINDAVGHSSPTPSFDVDGLIRAGLTLIPLHRWDAKDARGRDRGKTPRDGAWQARDYDSREVLEQARRDGRNVGVRLPPTWMVLDVDPRNFGGKDDPGNTAGRDPLAELARDARLDLSACPHVVTGSGGHHYYFRKPADVQVLDSLEDYPGVEFKSHGRQVVAPGSVHPNGRRYGWDDLAPFPEEAPQVPDTLLRLIRRPTRAHGEAAGFGELTPEMLADTLEQLDAEDFQDHDRWRDLMMACHHATAGDGRQEFIDWSTQDARYQGDAWLIGRRWDSLHATAGRGARPITARLLHKVVQEAGGHVAVADAADDFDVYEDPVELGRGVDDAALREPPKATGIEAVIDELNERHYIVLDNGFQIITEERDPVFRGRVRYQRLSKSDFRSSYEHELVEKNDKLVTKADAWLKSARRRQYKGLIFDPSGKGQDGWLNMWKGWSVQPKKGDWSLLRQLILEVLVDGDRDHFEWVLDWIAFMFQHPEQVAEVAVAFRGEKGTGKGTLGRALFKLAGASGLHISSPGHLTGRFNSHLQNCVCLFADEAFWAGNKEGESVLKQLVTEPTLTYEGKGRDAVTGRNHVHIVMASNNDWVVPAGMDGERRFAVFNVNNRRKGNTAFFRALNRQLDEGGLAAMLHDMLTRDLGDRHPRDSVPQTQALIEQKAMSQSPEESWWNGLLDSGRLPGLMIDLPWHEESVMVDRDELYDDYVAYAKKLNARPRAKSGLMMRIKKRAGIGEKQVVLEKGRKTWLWVLPQIDDARALWEKSMGGSAY
ncbi:bifunctional DNA primase/polymerase [Stenotrophomonas sp. MH1]|uniref:Bifunctional DNA primase/polymerase n=1 Tax=Stenotrophomonas capsici TaxID=3110230 RepID=A0ABU5V6Q0_9GAMM|nr:bifunctional DNA primase/polymerase [Stenotrophomonas sp. MH1]MEA5669036.1 bifunctional DNA primase/polymerase [Stenotrophomonas sp. MH1]